MNDSFPETIFPVRKRFHMISSTPAHKPTNNLKLKYLPDISKAASPENNYNILDAEE